MARHESSLGIPTRGGLYVPDSAKDDNRWFGVVLAVGERLNPRTKKYESCCPDLRFGDAVELSRWTGTMWQKYPLATTFGKVGMGEKVHICNPDKSSNERIEMAWGDQFTAQAPDQIIYKIADSGWLFRREGREPGAYPISDRVFVEFEKEIKSKVLEIVDNRRPDTIYGTVLDVGGEVDRVTIGDRVAVAPYKYSRIYYRDGRVVYSVRQGDILCRL